MDQTFLQLISLVVQLTNQIALLQQENAVLKTTQTTPLPETQTPRTTP